MKEELKQKMIGVIGTHSNALIDSIAERCAQVAIDFYKERTKALSMSDDIGRLLQRVELIYGKDEDVTYKVEMVGDEPWIVKHTYIPWERDDVIQLVRVNDL